VSSASEVTTLWRYTNLFIIIFCFLLLFFTPVLNSQGMKKITVCNIIIIVVVVVVVVIAAAVVVVLVVVVLILRNVMKVSVRL